MPKQLKRIQAGLLNYEYLVPVIAREDGPRARAAKQAASTAAQQYMNLKNSWRQLELVVATNFGSRDLVVTYTYDNIDLPPDKEAGGRCFQRHIRRLRAARRKRREELRYIYVTEGYHERRAEGFLGEDGSLEDKRIHHHAIINGTGPGDYEEIRSLWEYGGYIRVEPLDVHYYKELAKYLTKEAREFQRPVPGERTWRASRNLRKYQVEYVEIPSESVTLSPPFGAVDYETFGDRNPYGFAAFVGARYLLYEEDADHSYTRGRSRPPSLNNFSP